MTLGSRSACSSASAVRTTAGIWSVSPWPHLWSSSARGLVVKAGKTVTILSGRRILSNRGLQLHRPALRALLGIRHAHAFPLGFSSAGGPPLAGHPGNPGPLLPGAGADHLLAQGR